MRTFVEQTTSVAQYKDIVEFLEEQPALQISYLWGLSRRLILFPNDEITNNSLSATHL
jgi:hypothetical protein